MRFKIREMADLQEEIKNVKDKAIHYQNKTQKPWGEKLKTW